MEKLGNQPDESDANPAVTPRSTLEARAAGSTLSALAEGYLRDSMITGTATLALVVAGGGGAVLLVATVARHRPIGRQWLTIAVVLAVRSH
ncbi:hypothetical protein E1262_16370 [Jiangella aurantiaca]|uniref:Uncharacterized protein n=1 Tax=Jiangella aurantiaca TaxID=2530373 RepID=A0A4R5A894_9ACTN|nr:hypothetical protein E1262_16370 [Jiangella aurantiaca]